MRVEALFVLAVLIVSSGVASAQEQRHEVSIFIGAGSMQEIAEGFSSIFPTIITLGYLTRETDTSTPVLGVNYRHHFNRIISVGGTFNYQQFDDRYKVADVFEILSFATRYYTVMARVDFTYVRLHYFQMYSGVALGICHQNESGEDMESYNKTYPGFQVNVVGLRVGKRLAGYLELGLGCNGIAVAGATYAF